MPNGNKEGGEKIEPSKIAGLWHLLYEKIGPISTPTLLGFLIILLALFFLSITKVASPQGFSGQPDLRGQLGEGGCYFPDSAFTTIKSESADEVLKKLAKYNNLQGKKSQVQLIIDRARAAGLNYYIFLDIWSGEQSFGNDDKAFGCGVYDGKNRAPGFENQLNCAIDVMQDAINNRGNYIQPVGANIFTRFFYNYVGGMQDNYRKYGYVAGPDNPRVVIHQILAPDEVICSIGNSGPGVELVGDKLYPPLGIKMVAGKTYADHSCWLEGEKTECAVDYYVPAGTPVYAVTDGWIEKLKLQGERKGYYFYFHSNDGQVFAVYAHITPAGRLSLADSGQRVNGITKGVQLGTVFDHYVGPHLHFQLKINGHIIGKVGEHNYQSDYFGKVQ